MKAYIRFMILLGLVLIFGLTTGSDDPPKKERDTIVIDTTSIQKEQMQLQMEQKNRMSKWDSLLLKQDSLVKAKKK